MKGDAVHQIGSDLMRVLVLIVAAFAYAVLGMLLLESLSCTDVLNSRSQLRRLGDVWYNVCAKRMKEVIKQ